MEITNLLPLLVFFLFLNISISWSSPFSPTDNYLLNCGSPQDAAVDNRNFLGDASKSGSNFLSSGSSSTIEQTPSPDLSPLYHTARIFPKQAKYVFEIRKRGTHLVRLHFFPKFDVSNTLFHVSANGYLLLSDFNGLEKGKSDKNPFLKEFLVWAEIGELEIVFTPSKEAKFGFVNAIEVFAAPDHLIGDTAKSVTAEENKTINGITHQAMETVYRLNVGGPKVTPFNDTLWRTWIPDDGFLKSSSPVAKAIHFGGRIKYQNGGLSREVAPDNVYNSARVISNANASKSDSNITWILPVSVNYKYLVRLHFCDIASMALYELYFNVYISGNLAYENLDLSEKTRMLASPYYADFVVDPDNSGVLAVTISPSTLSDPARINAILNGLEVMRMNNSMGSLDGEVCVESILNTHSRGNAGILVPLVVITMLGVAFIILYSRRTMAQESLGWYRLPVDPSDGSSKYDSLPVSRKSLFS